MEKLREYLLEYDVKPAVEVPIILSKPIDAKYGQSFGQDFSYTMPDGTYIPSFYGQWGMDGHGGMDYPAATGTPIYAPCDLWVDNYLPNETYGDNLWAYSDVWKGEDGKEYRMEMVFAHLDRKYIEKKQVKRGEQIAISGNSGFPKTSTGPHLHWGVRLQSRNKGGSWVRVDGNNGYRGYFNQYLITQDMFKLMKTNDSPDVYAIDEIENKKHRVCNEFTLKMGQTTRLFPLEIETVPTLATFENGMEMMLTPMD